MTRDPLLLLPRLLLLLEVLLQLLLHLLSVL